MYFPTWKKIAKLNHYSRAGMVVTTVSWGFIILFMLFGLPAELAFSGVVLPFFATAALIAHLFSNATYIAGTIDLFKEAKPNTKLERWMTLAGLVLGFAGGIILSLTLPSLSFFTFLSTTTVTTGAIAGLANRFSSLGRRHSLERNCLLIAAILGVGMACTLIACGIPFLHITGVISFITAGPPLIASGIFVCLVTSLFMSGADYFSKMLRYIPRILGKDKEDGHHHEYEGSFFGAIFSIVAIIYFAANLHLLVGIHLTLTGLNVAATTITLLAKCFGVDGICSRIGRTLDGFIDTDNTTNIKVMKVMWVVSGAAGLMVIADIGFKIKDTLFPRVVNAIADTPMSANRQLKLLLRPAPTRVPRLTPAPHSEEEKTNTLTIITHASEKNSSFKEAYGYFYCLLWTYIPRQIKATLHPQAQLAIQQQVSQRCPSSLGAAYNSVAL